MDTPGARYAVFFAPPSDGELWAFGSRLIGYDAQTGLTLPTPSLGPDWLAMTEEPRRYGFHGTLRAPFHLKDGTSEYALLTAATALAASWAPFAIPPLHVGLLGSFVALIPLLPSVALDKLAADCVRMCDPFRAPLTQADRARRNPSGLSARQVAHLERWGYPHVFEDFRFHMTLTGSLREARREPLRSELARLFGDLGEAVRVEGIAIFRQADRAGPFRVLARIPFGS